MPGPEHDRRPSRRTWLLVASPVLAALVAAGWWLKGWWRESSIASLQIEARQALGSGRWKELESAAGTLVAWNPADGQAWIWRAQAARQQKSYASAAHCLRQVPLESPERALAESAYIDLHFGDYNRPLEAVAFCREILERDPTSAIAHQRLIFFYALTLQRHALIEQARRAIELECEPREAYVYLFFVDSLHFTNAIELNRRWLAGDPSSELFSAAHAVHLATSLAGGAPRDDLEIVRAARRLAAGKERAMTELLSAFPHNLELLAWHVDQAIERGDVPRVESLLGQSPPEADDDNRFWRYAGWVHLQKGRLDQADAAYARALSINPLDWETRHFLADLRRRQKRFDEVDSLQKLVRRARDLEREIEHEPNARLSHHDLLAKLADYAVECGDEAFARGLRRQMELPAAAAPGTREAAG